MQGPSLDVVNAVFLKIRPLPNRSTLMMVLAVLEEEEQYFLLPNSSDASQCM